MQLFMKGPFTVGIFRKSANARVVKEMREKLDSEVEVSVGLARWSRAVSSVQGCGRCRNGSVWTAGTGGQIREVCSGGGGAPCSLLHRPPAETTPEISHPAASRRIVPTARESRHALFSAAPPETALTACKRAVTFRLTVPRAGRWNFS